MDSSEYKTLTQYYPHLVSCIQQSPSEIAIQLRPFGILAPSDFSYLNNPYHDDPEKAQRLLDTVLTQVKIDPQVFHHLVSALKAVGLWTKPVVSSLETAYASNSTLSLRVVTQPEDVLTKPGEKVKFAFKTLPDAYSYQWFFDSNRIEIENKDFDGSTTDHLVLGRCIPRYKGFFMCTATDDTGTSLSSRIATLMIDGEEIKQEHSKLLGEIFTNSNIDFSESGVNVQKLLEGNSGLTYEELQYVMKENPTTRILSKSLKQKLQSRLKEEHLYQAAISAGKTVSLSYVKILALGPGQVGKSTFIKRLLDLEDEVLRSTGLSETKEVIKFSNKTGAVAKDEFKLCQLPDLIRGLLGLLGEPTATEIQAGTTSVNESTSRSSSNYRSATSISSLEDGVQVSTTEATPNIKANQRESDISEKLPAANYTTEIDSNIAIETVTLTTACQPSLPALHIQRAIDKFRKLRCEICMYSPDVTKLDMLFNIADVGGQPAFLDMLPSLTLGPALYLLFSKLINDKDEVISINDFTTQQTVKYSNRSGNGPQDCQGYTYTLQDILFGALSSIASFGLSDLEVEKYITKSDSKAQKNSSLTLMLGTFADMISKENSQGLIDAEGKFKKHLESTVFYKDNLVKFPKASPPKLFFRVNNKASGNEEIIKHRKFIQDVIKDEFKLYEIPTAWLGLSICMKLLADDSEVFQVSFDDCIQIGRQLNMNKEMVEAALNFLHKYIGLIMYFPSNNNQIICNPQVLFSSVSKLIFNVYDSAIQVGDHFEVTAQQKYFELTGIFTLKTVLYVKPEEEKDYLPISELIEVLLCLNIAAEIKSHDNIDQSLRLEGKLYFLPAILRMADTTSSLADLREQTEELLPEPLYIRFTTGYVPMGFVCALTANLISEREFYLVPFVEKGHQLVYKNRVRFRFNGKFDILMLSGPKHLRFSIRRCSTSIRSRFIDDDCCPLIKTTICQAADSVIRSLQHGSLFRLSVGYELAFRCPEHEDKGFGLEPLAAFVHDKSLSTTVIGDRPQEIKCVDSECLINSSITTRMEMWLGEPNPPEISKQPTIEGRKIVLEAKSTKPITYQWFKDDKVICEGADFEGCTTSELEIKTSCSKCEGVYKCRVENSDGKILSDGIKYNLFIYELKRRTFSDCAIKMFAEQNINSLEELQNACEEDTNRKGITSLLTNYGDRGRLNDFCSSRGQTQKKSIPESELEKCQRCSNPIAPLLIRYIERKLFDHLQTYLVDSKKGWKQSKDLADDPSCKKYKFQPPNSKCMCLVTLINCHNYLVISVEPQETQIVNSNYCFEVKEKVIEGINKAPSELKYDDTIEFGHFCPHEVSPAEQCNSVAIVDDNYLTCTENDEHSCKLQEKHDIWFKLYDFETNGRLISSVQPRNVYFARDHWMLNKLTDAQQKQITGEGIAIAILDTGIDPDHPVIGKIQYIEGQTRDNITNKKCSHGTSVAGIAAGKHLKRSEYAILSAVRIPKKSQDPVLPVGAAPNASLVIFKVAETNEGRYIVAKVTDALEKIKKYNENDLAGDPNKNKISVIVMPFQLKRKDDKIEKLLHDLNTDQKVVCLVSAGNHGYSRGLGYPAYSDHVLTIGANTENCEIASFSSRPISLKQKKDILYVLGEDVLAPVSERGRDWRGLPYHDYPEDEGKSNCFLKVMIGTSFSAPAMAGLIAILMQLDQSGKNIGLDKSKPDAVTMWKEFFENELISKQTPMNGVVTPDFVKIFLRRVTKSKIT